jgi:predicted nucleotidyltransferase
MLEHAIAVMSWESERSLEQLKQALRDGDRATHSSLRYALARVVAREIGALGFVRAVYVYGSPMENRAQADSDIDLLVQVGRRSKYARRRLQELNRTLLEEYQRLMGPDYCAMHYLLDFHLVTSTDITRRRGYAAIIGDPHALPPEKIYDSAIRSVG